jgi:hypothetical protein
LGRTPVGPATATGGKENPVSEEDVSSDAVIMGDLSKIPLPDPASSTPLEIHETERVPPAPLWAMKDRRHFFGLPGHGDALRIRDSLGDGDATVYFIDDGRTHCVVGRRVGQPPDGCVYCLVGRIKLDRYEALADGTVAVNEAFSDAHDVSLCGVFEDESEASEVILVHHYAHASDVPAEYLPPSPFIDFPDDLPTDY